ncbi:MAG: UxaA family hydrolase [Geminicoccaceae bacterium]
MIGDGPVRWGFPNINDNAEITEMIASGAHLSLFSTGRGSVVGSAISPVIKVCANPETYRRLADDMDVDAGRILEGRGTLDEKCEIVDLVTRVAGGEPDEVGGARASGVRADLQELRAASGLACLPA